MTAPTSPYLPESPSAADAGTALALFPEDNQDDEEFANLMRERTKQRKEREDAALAHLRVQVRRLEAALAAETKRRVQAVAEVKKEAQAAIDQVSSQWKESLEKEGTEADERLSLLDERISILEKRWEEDVIGLETAITTKATVWKSALEDVQNQAEAERKSRLQREGRLMQRIQEVSDEYQEKWKEERRDRTADLTSLTERVHVQEGTRDSQVKGLEARIQEALKDLDAALKQEISERQVQDESIVGALNKYTAQVQTSLSFVSGV